jgi:hypothetical protein
VPLVLICLGGALGTGARYVVGGLAVRWLGADFPYGTLVVNVVGSFLIGVVQHVALHSTLMPETARLVVGIGVLGASPPTRRSPPRRSGCSPAARGSRRGWSWAACCSKGARASSA